MCANMNNFEHHGEQSTASLNETCISYHRPVSLGLKQLDFLIKIFDARPLGRQDKS